MRNYTLRKKYEKLLQCFGYIQSKNKDAKSAVSLFVFLIEMCDRFLEHQEMLTALKGLKGLKAYPICKGQS